MNQMEAPIVSKRPREEGQVDFEEEDSKRHKPYNHILSILDSEEEDSTEDLSPLITTLQQEITCVSNSNNQNDQNTLPTTHPTPNPELKEEEESDNESVMRHLLQASDDELGIPTTGDALLAVDFGEGGLDGGDDFSSLCHKLWELEDERANYYAVLQSELFL